MQLQLKRVYEPKTQGDGFRVLVDRLWPRGLSKQAAGVDLWLKEIAPSAELRRWFGHDPEKWQEFRRRYREELRANRAAVAELSALAGRQAVTLLYGAADVEHNQAVVLRELLDDGQGRRP